MKTRSSTSAQLKTKEEENKPVIFYGGGDCHPLPAPLLLKTTSHVFLLGHDGLSGIMKEIGNCTTSQTKKKRKLAGSGDRGGGGKGGMLLPAELLHLIAKRTDFFPDLASFASVCLHWRSVVLGAITNHNWICCQSPLLMILDSGPDCSRVGFFSPYHGRSFELQVPAKTMRSKWCVGASHGWLVLLNKLDYFRSAVQLFNPFTMACIPLPPLNRTKNDFCVGHVFDYKSAIRKVALSGDPAGSDGVVVVMADTLRDGSLITCRLGDTCWTIVWCYYPINDFCFCSEVSHFHGKFYALFGCQVVSLDAAGSTGGDGGGGVQMQMVLSPFAAQFGRINYLVEHLGELIWINFWIRIDHGHTKMTTSVYVYRFDRPRGEWTEVHGIGEHMIFVSGSQSVSFSSRDHPGWRANCIYFAFDRSSRYDDMGIFDVGDREIHPFPMNELPWPEQPLWVIQNSSE